MSTAPKLIFGVGGHQLRTLLEAFPSDCDAGSNLIWARTELIELGFIRTSEEWLTRSGSRIKRI